MKKIILTIIFTSMALIIGVNPVSAKYGMAGCGLGSLIIENNDFTQVFAATSNGTAGSQTFGITTGTSNCTKDGVVKNEKAQEVFVHMNYNSLEKEMAVGKGEKLNALATLVGCSKNVNGFSEFAKANYSKLFSSNNGDPSILLSSLKQEMSKDVTLKSSCTL
jgi:hypothetical protein